MSIRQSVSFQLGLLGVAVVFSLWISTKMPDVVPTHWNASGQIDGYGTKWLSLAILPGVAAFIAAMTVVLPKISPEKFEIKPFESSYAIVMLIIATLMFSMHVVVAEMSAGAKWDITRIMMGILFVSFIFVGNFLGKVQPNYFMGVRTPWTLSDHRVWAATHRSAAKLWVWGSLVGLLLVCLQSPFYLSFSYFMVISLIPVGQSYFYYRKLHPRV